MKIPRLSLALLSNAAGKLVGFFRIQGIAAALGATAVADALLMSTTVLSIFDVVFVSGSALLLVQALYIRRDVRGARHAALLIYTRSAALWLYGSVAFGLLAAGFSRIVVNAIAPGFTTAGRDIFAHLTI